MSYMEQLKSAFREQIWEQEQVVQLRQKYAELDPRTQAIVQLSSLGAGALIMLGILISLLFGSFDRQSKIRDSEALIQYTKDAAKKIEEARRVTSGGTQSAGGLNTSAPLPELLEQVALRASVSRGSMEVVEGDPAVLKLSRVSIRQLVRIFFVLENQIPDIEWKKLSLDTQGDTKGYLWANIEVRRGGK
jgi:hypothetical protein